MRIVKKKRPKNIDFVDTIDAFNKEEKIFKKIKKTIDKRIKP